MKHRDLLSVSANQFLFGGFITSEWVSTNADASGEKSAECQPASRETRANPEPSNATRYIWRSIGPCSVAVK